MKKSESQNPRIRPEPRLIDRLLDALVIMLIAGLWAFTLKAYLHLPSRIVVHFDAAGNPDGYGGKWNLLMMPALATLLAAGLFVLNLYPHVFNFPVKITPENAFYQYRLATRLMRWINLLTTLLLAMISWMMVASAGGTMSKGWIVVVFIFAGLMFIPFVVYMILSGRKK